MSSDAWRNALAVVKSRFERLAERYPQFHHRVYEIRGKAGHVAAPLKDVTSEDSQVLRLQRSHWTRFRCLIPTTIADPSFPDVEAKVQDKWSSNSIPTDDRWEGPGWFHGEGYKDFSAIAADAWKLIEVRAKLLPIPTQILTLLADLHLISCHSA